MSVYSRKINQFQHDIENGFSPVGALAMQLDEKAVEKARRLDCYEAELIDIKNINKASIDLKIKVAKCLKEKYSSCRNAIKQIYVYT